METHDLEIAEGLCDNKQYGQELSDLFRGVDGFEDFDLSSSTVYEQVVSFTKSLVAQANGEAQARGRRRALNGLSGCIKSRDIGRQFSVAQRSRG